MGRAALGELLDTEGGGMDSKGFLVSDIVHRASVKKRGGGIDWKIGHVLCIAVGQVQHGGDVAAWPKVIL